ncbi:hypothetical protein JCM21531_2289 [Acetivibrio straminisolvens JCM 21531]|uniref:Teneurin-like YD-shell domain-containing protein n=2 Tax=Acetivibrio straminisolvens TaxID=253314 RepID=W4V7U1_9FIRM|nr:hypothetical protein JCM21531_2289 [Acetivibrio straminisolvens JCM 21531]
MENIYDAENLRSISIENGRYNRYVYSGRNIACEVDEDWGLKDRIVRGHTILQKEDSNKGIYYYIHNAHGDITALTDGRGEVVNSYSYDAFGNMLESVEKVDNRFKYSGEVHDPVTGQYYLRARYYNPSVGRFMQEDTFRGDGLNLYTYVANNPIKYIDPTGHCKEGVGFNDVISDILGGNSDGIIKKIPGLNWILDYFNNEGIEKIGNIESEFLTDEYFYELNALYSKVKKENSKWWDIFGNGKKAAAEAVINRMMDDLEANPDALVDNPNYKLFFDTFDKNIRQLDSITERMHYFRNTLNSYSGAPTDLDDMIDMAAGGEWKLFSTIGTAYHRYDYGDIDGALNVKFVSADGRFEAVYNTGTGKIVTDPANMGTYNYVPGSITGFFKHDKYDVKPFEKWGNTSELSYKDIMNLQSGHMTIKAQVNYFVVKNLIEIRKTELETKGK